MACKKYTLLGKTGMRVSKICLGTMTFGTDWPFGVDEKESRAIFDAFLEWGGNYLDTANLYTETTSEKYLGKFIAETGNRDELIIGSKYSLRGDIHKINNTGNHRKNLVQSVEGSLKRLQVDYLDLLYLHSWDFTTPVEDVMRSLNLLVEQGKILHFGFSDTPAWVISRGQTIAEMRGWEPISALQMEYSLAERTCEREILPMSDHYGMSFNAWSPLANGILTGKYTEGPPTEAHRMKPESKRMTKKNLRIGQLVRDLSEQKDCSPAALAIAWLFTKTPHMIPVIGVRNTQQLQEQLAGISLNLTSQELEQLEQATAIERGFPFDFLDQEHMKLNLFGNKKDQFDWL